jgi:UDP-N-acetylglucosamine 4,6-dehydratase/5-epimerase
MKNVLVTGGSGFVGRSLVNKLQEQYPDLEVTSLSRSEGNISQLLVECTDKRPNIIMADVRDAHAIRTALKDKDTVIHLAAMKRVDLAEVECREAASINVIGTMNVLDAFCGDTFILMSTDKAVEPVNCYGGTKLVVERMVLERARKAKPGQRFMIVRSGNIVGSTGSVIDIWKHQILKHNEITVTSLDMIRFYTNVEGVVRLYMAVLERGENAKIYFTPSGDPIVLKDLVDQAIKQYGNKDTKVKIIGLREGERLSEKMRTPDEINTISGFADQ